MKFDPKRGVAAAALVLLLSTSGVAYAEDAADRRHDNATREARERHALEEVIQRETSKLEPSVLLVVLLVEPPTAPTSRCGWLPVPRMRPGGR
jgi:hypothetical protein